MMPEGKLNQDRPRLARPGSDAVPSIRRLCQKSQSNAIRSIPLNPNPIPLSHFRFSLDCFVQALSRPVAAPPLADGEPV
ncbi:MAG TPA: hypothetical protein VGG72_14140 [Bryobacteraceae bacterium]|jgi:hypothetical protein